MIFRNKRNANTQNDATLEVKEMHRLSDGFIMIGKVLAGISLIWTITYLCADWGVIKYVLIGLVVALWSGNPLFKL